MAAHSELPADLVLAVDAGGTKTAALIARQTGTMSWCVLGRGRTQSGNPLSVGVDEATRSIAEAVTSARRDANQPTARIARAVLSVAGAADADIADQILNWARKAKLAGQTAVVSDVMPVLAAACDEAWGIALVAGTGSIAFGRSRDGRTVRSGGWGYLLGDDGSGYAIGRAGLRHALANIDDPDSMTQMLLDDLHASSTAEITKIIYRDCDPRAAIASVAERVISAAEVDNAAARAILDEAAGDLAALAARTAKSLGLAEEVFPLAVAGGVLVGSRYLREQVEVELRLAAMRCDMRLVADPLEGCLRLASPAFSGLGVHWHDSD
jgi:N-acetylglucosamine kinase-like BadF-type ATPase